MTKTTKKRSKTISTGSEPRLIHIIAGGGWRIMYKAENAFVRTYEVLRETGKSFVCKQYGGTHTISKTKQPIFDSYEDAVVEIRRWQRETLVSLRARIQILQVERRPPQEFVPTTLPTPPEDLFRD